MKRLLAVSAVVLALGACNDRYASNGRSLSPIPAKTMALMAEKGMAKGDPILVRLYKKESELEVWKQISGGDYALLKTFPICRWSGQLGPKTREGDRQAPEGFYTVTPAQMNPNSAYYLSFDTGYPNAFDRSHGRTGSHLMVHGTCSSRGCYAMTDEGISEVYALARESFSAGQRGFQVQAYPFRQTAENYARYRNDPNIAFWKNLKQGNDHFEITKREPRVGVCGGRYAFDTVGRDCKPDPTLAPVVAQKEEQDRREVAEFVAKGTPSVRLVYADGGGHESFRSAMPTVVADAGQNFSILEARPRRNLGEVSRPDALAAGPREVAMDETGAKSAGPGAKPGGKAKPTSVLASLAIAKAAPPEPVPAKADAPRGRQVAATRTVLASADPDEPLPASALTPAEKPFYERMLSSVFNSKDEAAAAEPATPSSALTPVPPTRIAVSPKPAPAGKADKKPQAQREGAKPQASRKGPEKHAAASLLAGSAPTVAGAAPIRTGTSGFTPN